MAETSATGITEISARTFTMEVSAEHVDKMLKRGTFRDFSVNCDEGPRLGGEDSAPPPLAYMGMALGFCLLTQVARYSAALKVPVDHAAVQVTGTYHVEGSVLQETVQASCEGFHQRLTITSPAPSIDVAKLIRIAEAGCFVNAALTKPTPVTTEVTLNGAPFAYQ